MVLIFSLSGSPDVRISLYSCCAWSASPLLSIMLAIETRRARVGSSVRLAAYRTFACFALPFSLALAASLSTIAARIGRSRSVFRRTSSDGVRALGVECRTTLMLTRDRHRRPPPLGILNTSGRPE